MIEPVRSFDDASIQDWQTRHPLGTSVGRLAPDAEVFSDGLFCFRRFADAGHAHTVLETAGGRAACELRGARWVNVLLGNLKRAISGTYHAIRQGKYDHRKSLFGTRGATLRKRRTASTAASVCARCCRDWRAR